MATAPTTAAPPLRRPRLPYQTPRDTWDRDSCLAALEDWARRFGRPPRAYEWSPSHGRTAGLLAGDRLCVWERDHPRWPATGTVIRHCGPWLGALHAAGVGAASPDRGGRSQRERVEAAQRLAAEGLGRAAIAELLEVHPDTVSAYLHATPCRDCAGPVVTAGADRCGACARRRRWSSWTRASFAERLVEWVAKEGGPPGWHDWSPTHAPAEGRWRREHPYWPSAAVATGLYGGWQQALLEAGLRPRRRRWSRDQTRTAIARWAATRGRAPRWEEWRRAGEDHPSAATAARQFGGWSAALEATGLRCDSSRRARWDARAVAEAIDLFATVHGRFPTRGDLARPDSRFPDPTTVARYWDSVDAALDAAECGKR
jgi:hypothetical protein